MKTDYNFGDAIWIRLFEHSSIPGIFVRESFGCALVVTETSQELLHVGFDIIKQRKTEKDYDCGVWRDSTNQEGMYDDWCIVSILDESGDTPYRYTTIGWRPIEFKNTNKWIVDDEVVSNVEAWVPLPKPFNRKDD